MPRSRSPSDKESNGYSHTAAMIRGDNPSWNGGARDQMLVGRNGGKGMRSLLSFPLASIAADSIVHSASLDLWTAGVTSTTAVKAIQLIQTRRHTHRRHRQWPEHHRLQQRNDVGLSDRPTRPRHPLDHGGRRHGNPAVRRRPGLHRHHRQSPAFVRHQRPRLSPPPKRPCSPENRSIWHWSRRSPKAPQRTR